MFATYWARSRPRVLRVYGAFRSFVGACSSGAQAAAGQRGRPGAVRLRVKYATRFRATSPNIRERCRAARCARRYAIRGNLRFFTNPHSMFRVVRFGDSTLALDVRSRGAARWGTLRTAVHARGARAGGAGGPDMVEMRRHAARDLKCSSVAESDCDMCEITLRPYIPAPGRCSVCSLATHRITAPRPTSTISQTREKLALGAHMPVLLI